MKAMSYSEAIDDALCFCMSKDPRIVLFGEDVHTLHFNLFVRFGERRVRPTPISEAAFVGAAVGAAMAGLRPVVEVMIVDFLGVAMDAVMNHAAKIDCFSGGKWKAPLVLRTACGGGYGDGGQHEQSLWGWLAHIPGLTVVVPSNPIDAGGLMISALEHGGPVVYLEHKLLSPSWLDFLGKGGRKTVEFDLPKEGSVAPRPKSWTPVPLGRAAVRSAGEDITFVSIGVGVHRALEAARMLKGQNISAGVIDLRTVTPLDSQTLLEAVSKSRRVLVIDEDYRDFGLSGEIAALLLESALPVRYGRVCTEGTIPYARRLEDAVLPSTERIVAAALRLL